MNIAAFRIHNVVSEFSLTMLTDAVGVFRFALIKTHEDIIM